MGFLSDFIKKIKSLFHKNEDSKLIEEPKKIIDYEESKNDFDNELRVELPNESKKRKVETLVCEGDGLGIQPKLHG